MLEQICHARGIRVISFGSSNGADIQLLETKPFPSYQEIKIKIFNLEYQIELMLLGKFQIINSLTALGIVLATQKENDVAFLVNELKNLTGVAGRLECVNKVILQLQSLLIMRIPPMHLKTLFFPCGRTFPTELYVSLVLAGNGIKVSAKLWARLLKSMQIYV